MLPVLDTSNCIMTMTAAQIEKKLKAKQAKRSEEKRTVPDVFTRLFICGGGPAGTALIHQAAKRGKLSRLLTETIADPCLDDSDDDSSSSSSSDDDDESEDEAPETESKKDNSEPGTKAKPLQSSGSIGVIAGSSSAKTHLSTMLIEARGEETLGSGNLGSYQIRSNTHAISFTRGCIKVQSLSLSIFVSYNNLFSPLKHPTGDLPSPITRCNRSHCPVSSLITDALLL